MPDLLDWQPEKDMSEEAFICEASPLATVVGGMADADILTDAMQ